MWKCMCVPLKPLYFASNVRESGWAQRESRVAYNTRFGVKSLLLTRSSISHVLFAFSLLLIRSFSFSHIFPSFFISISQHTNTTPSLDQARRNQHTKRSLGRTRKRRKNRRLLQSASVRRAQYLRVCAPAPSTALSVTTFILIFFFFSFSIYLLLLLPPFFISFLFSPLQSY